MSLVAFAELQERLEAAATAEAKAAAVAAHLEAATPADAAWTVHLLARRRRERLVPPRSLAAWAREAAELPGWLYSECRRVVGDAAETAALALATAGFGDAASDDGGPSLAAVLEERLAPLPGLARGDQRAAVRELWRTAGGAPELLVVNKLLLGTFVPGVGRKTLERAIATVAGLPPAVIGRRLEGAESTHAAAWERLTTAAEAAELEAVERWQAARAARRPAAAEPAEPVRATVLLVYAAPGRGAGAGIYGELTLAVPDGDELVPVARLSADLPEPELRRLDRWIRRHTTERFGPVRSVEPVQAFTLAAAEVRRSRRHKAGLVLAEARIERWHEEGEGAGAPTTLEELRRRLPDA